jgi:hypothetical protein
VACETSWAFAAFTASRSTRPSDSGLDTASELNNESELGVELGPETAPAGVAPISPANSAKLSTKSPDRFALGKILTSLIYVSECEELAHRNPRTTQESRVR